MIITLKDGSKKEYDQPMSAYDIARDISDGLARAACIAEIKNACHHESSYQLLLWHGQHNDDNPLFRKVRSHILHTLFNMQKIALCDTSNACNSCIYDTETRRYR